MANIFQQGRDALKMRSQIMEMQKQLRQITHMESNRGIEVVVAADQTIISVKIDGEERKDIVEVLNKAFKGVQEKAKKRMMEMGNLGDLLGGLR